MVYSAKNEDGRKVAIKMSFCETKRLKASENEIKVLK